MRQFFSQVANMRAMNIVTLILVIIGGINWLLVGALSVDAVAAVFGVNTALTKAAYVIVGLSALWQIKPLVQTFSIDEAIAEANVGRGGSLR